MSVTKQKDKKQIRLSCMQEHRLERTS